MTTVKVQTAIMDSMTKKTTKEKGDDPLSGNTKLDRDSLFSSIMAQQNQSIQTNGISGIQPASGITTEVYRKHNDSTKDINTETVKGTIGKKTGKATKEARNEKTTQEESSVDQVDVSGEQVEEALDTENAKAELQNVLQSFLQNLQNILGISEEELNTLMEQSGLAPTDLLNPENLTNLILNQFGSDSVTDALLNEPLANALQQGMQTLSEVTEQMEAIMSESNTPLTPELLTAIKDQLAAKGTGIDQMKSQDNRENDSEEQAVPVTEEAESKGFTVVVEKERESSDSQTSKEALRGNDSRSEGTNQVETKADFVDYFASRVEQLQTDGVSQTVEPVNVRNIITQIVDQIKVTINQSQTSMQMLLNPENLGRVELTVAHKEGVMTAHFTVQNQVTKEALESSMNTLKESFEEQGLKVADVEVTIGNYTNSFTRDNENGKASEEQNSKTRGHHRGLVAQDDEEETLTNEPIRANYNGTVEYTA